MTIWFHQPFGLVHRSGGAPAIERRYAQLVGLPLARLRRYPGSASSWQNHALPSSSAFVVELPAVTSSDLIKRAAATPARGAIGLRRAVHAQFRMATGALELEQSGLSYQRVPPNYRFPYGHTHKEQEEVYVVLRGSGRMKLDGEIVEHKEWDAVRVPLGMWRGYEAGSQGLEILVIGAPNLGEDPREDVDGQRDWWAD